MSLKRKIRFCLNVANVLHVSFWNSKKITLSSDLFNRVEGSRFGLKTMKRLFVILLFMGGIGLEGGAQEANLLTIDGVELLRRGKQVSLYMQMKGQPVYEISDNLPAKTLVVKFKNAIVTFPDNRNDRLFNDPDLEGVRFLEFDRDVWAQFKLRKDNLLYEEEAGEGVLIFQFRPRITLNPVTLPLAPEPASHQLTSLKLDDSHPDYTRIIAEFSSPVRLFVLESPETIRLRFANALPQEGFELPTYEDGRVKIQDLLTDENQFFLNLHRVASELSIQKEQLTDPPRWQIDFHGLPKIKTQFEEIGEAEPVDPKAAEKEEIIRNNREIRLRVKYQNAEIAFRQGKYDQAIQLFQAIYADAKGNVAEFQDEFHPLGIQSLFRLADTVYTVLERRRGRNYHQAIDAYKTAIRIAKNIGIQEAMIPHGYLRVGRSYQRMKFHQEANLEYELLQKEYPASIEAQESSYWKALNQIDRRKWELAISDFEEYLKTMPNPKYIARTYYRMAQAYYQLGRFALAKENFDRARKMDSEYVKNEPMLLFHMGETYYENADYENARGVFKLLLNRYPDADFSKLVALRLGDFLRDEGKNDEAIATYRNAINSYSLEIALMGKMRIANIQAERPYSNEYQQALTVYDEIINLYKTSPQVEEALLRKGLTLTLYGKYQDAIATLVQFMERYPQSIYVRRNTIQDNIDENLKGLVDLHYQAENYLDVITTYRDFKSKYLLNFRFDTTLFQVAMSYKSLGFYDESLDLFRFLETRANVPMLELIQLQAAETLVEKGDLSQARNRLARFLKQYPNSPYDADARQRLSSVYKEEKEFAKAIVVYEQTIKKYHQDEDLLRAEVVPELYYELGKMYEEMGRYTEAAAAYQNAILRYNHPLIGPEVPDYIIQSHFLSAKMLYKIRNDVQALEAYERAITTYENRTEPNIKEQIHWAKYQSGTLYKHLNQIQQALDVFQNLIDSPEGEGKLWKKLALENHQALTQQIAYENYLNN